MSNTLKFRIQSLLKEKNDETISGPMSPFEFAKECAKGYEFKFNRLASVWFDDGNIFQNREYGELTGHDTLIIGCQYEDDLWLSLWIDKGVSGVPAAMCYGSDRKVTITPLYARQTFVRKLTEKEIAQVFTHIFENPHEISIKPFKPVL